jgi:hypothetical protein
MPVDYPRTEVHFPPELSHKLELLKKDAYATTGRHLSKNRLVVEIVRMFFEKRGVFEKDAEDLLRFSFEVVKQEAQSGSNPALRSTRK